MGSSQTRARTRVPCIGRRILNHCTNRKDLFLLFLVFLGPCHDTWYLIALKKGLMNEWRNEQLVWLTLNIQMLIWLNEGKLYIILFSQNGLRPYRLALAYNEHRFQKWLYKLDLWGHGAVPLITVPSVGKSSRLLARLAKLCAQFPPPLAVGWNAASIRQTEPEITHFCFRFSSTSAKLASASWGWRMWRMAP